MASHLPYGSHNLMCIEPVTRIALLALQKEALASKAKLVDEARSRVANTVGSAAGSEDKQSSAS